MKEGEEGWVAGVGNGGRVSVGSGSYCLCLIMPFIIHSNPLWIYNDARPSTFLLVFLSSSLSLFFVFVVFVVYFPLFNCIVRFDLS